MNDANVPTVPDSGKKARRRFLWVSPAAMLAWAAILALAYGVSCTLGMREAVSALFATSHADSIARLGGAAIHVLLYLGFIVLVPILILAAGIFAALTRIAQRTR
jgi:CHASE2 domain-containing sensor protein